MNAYLVECAWDRKMVLARTLEEAIEKFKKEIDKEKGLEKNQKEIIEAKLLYSEECIIKE